MKTDGKRVLRLPELVGRGYADFWSWRGRYRVEIYTAGGVQLCAWQGGSLKPLGAVEPYVRLGGQAYNWAKIPLIPLKYNESETPLLRRVKSLQAEQTAEYAPFGEDKLNADE